MGGVCAPATLDENHAAASRNPEKNEAEENQLWEQFPGCCTAQHMQDEVRLANSNMDDSTMSRQNMEDPILRNPAEDTFAGDPELENLEAEFEARFASQHGIFKELEKQSGDLDAIGVELLTIRRPSDTTGAPPRTDQETRSSTSSDTTIPPVENQEESDQKKTIEKKSDINLSDSVTPQVDINSTILTTSI